MSKSILETYPCLDKLSGLFKSEHIVYLWIYKKKLYLEEQHAESVNIWLAITKNMY